MADPIITKIGDVSAYLDAVAHGFEGTRAEFGELLANSANYAQSAESAASAAIASAATATTKAGEAITAAIAAQTAKTQTEAAASQALTDIGTAESGAISAIQTEGATQTANATAQAQAAATSATTASTKASEASASATTATTKSTEAAASATSAANSASAAQGVLDSIPEDYSDLSEDVDQLKADLRDVERKYQTWNIDLTSDSYATEITNIYVNTGDILDIEVTQQSNANIAVYGNSQTLPFSSVGNYVFTAQADGYLRFYYKSVHCKIKFRNNVITSEFGNSTELVASQKLVNIVQNDVNTIVNAFNNVTGYGGAIFENGRYFIGTTVGATVHLSGSTTNWDYTAVPLFVEAGKKVHCITRGNNMCCIAKSNSNEWIDNVPIAVMIAKDDTSQKEYTVTTSEDGYYWFSGRKGETFAYIENSSGEIEVTVDVNGSGNFTSFTDCLRALQNVKKKKTIFVKEGIYNIYEELGGAEYISSIADPTQVNWRDVQPAVPQNTKIIGQGNVVLTFNPGASVIGSNNMAFLFSPLNIDSDCEVENIAIECTNCRYALHIESSGIADYNDSVMKFKNLRCKKTKGTYGTQYVCATGIGSRQKWYFDSCSFEGDLDICWSVHVNNSVANDMAVVIMNNCVFVCTANNPEKKNTVRFVSSNNQSVKQNIAKLNNCYTNGKVFLENNNTRQQWDVTLLGCEYAGTGQSSAIVDNPYPIKEY